MNIRRQLPPLNGLRAFEVVSRNSSLSRAAEELNVTPSAVGHQIRVLEKNLGVRLFNRESKRLTLTKTGERYAQLLTDGFNTLYRATQSVRRQTAGRPITVSATPAVALRWLAPTLDSLREEGLEDFRLDASSREANLAAGEADLDIRYGRSVEPDLFYKVLFSESVFPVCCPEYAAEHGLRAPADLVKADLLFVDDWGYRGGTWSAWRDWCDVADLNSLELNESGRFTKMDQAVVAAARGDGIAIGARRHLNMSHSSDSNNNLQRLFEPSLEVRYCTFLVALPEIAEEPTIRRLIGHLTALSKQHGHILHEGAF